ncbi:MAG: hypothetical protein MZV64_72980 [Ignavibacteriales bacterium]|nr:hypothetical protein [Ignavibacteriales bacterium]
MSQVVWALFLGLNVAADVRVARGRPPDARAPLARRHRPQAHPDRRRGRTRAARGRQDHRAPRAGLPAWSASSTIAPRRTTSATAGLPLLGTTAETGEICQRERVDQIYVALPLDEHHRMLAVIEAARQES